LDIHELGILTRQCIPQICDILATFATNQHYLHEIVYGEYKEAIRRDDALDHRITPAEQQVHHRHFYSMRLVVVRVAVLAGLTLFILDFFY
jgi:hypothetical protein